MGLQTSQVMKIAQNKKWPLRIIKGEKWKLWQRDKIRADWLVVGAHGCSEHEADINVPNLHPTLIYFLTQRLVAAPGNPDSWYLNTAAEGGRWSQSNKEWHEIEPGEWRHVPSSDAGRVEVFNSAANEYPFDYHLSRYAEEKHLETITDMYESNAKHPFDVITVSSNGVAFSEILRWLASDGKRHYPNIVAGFCNSSSKSKFITPFGDYIPDGALERQKVRTAKPLPHKPLPQKPVKAVQPSRFGTPLPPVPGQNSQNPRFGTPLPPVPGQSPQHPRFGTPLPPVPGQSPQHSRFGTPLPPVSGQSPQHPHSGKPLPTKPLSRKPLTQMPHGGPPKTRK